MTRIRIWSAVSGFVGVACISTGALLTSLTYKGRMGQHYQIWNHFVSELGEVGISELAWVFNGRLIVGGTFITLFMLGTASGFRNWFSVVMAVSGLITGVSATLVGVFPMNDLQNHIRVAMLFFNMGLFTMAIFSLYIAFSRQKQFPRWFCAPGAVAALCFALFLNIPAPSKSTEPALAITARLLANRPSFWFLAIMEWAVVIVVLVWVLIASLIMLHQS